MIPSRFICKLTNLSSEGCLRGENMLIVVSERYSFCQVAPGYKYELNMSEIVLFEAFNKLAFERMHPERYISISKSPRFAKTIKFISSILEQVYFMEEAEGVV